MSQADFARLEDATTERMKRELWSDLMGLVESGDLSGDQANEWFNAKCDQWEGGDR